MITTGNLLCMNDAVMTRIRAKRGMPARIARECGITRAAVVKWEKVPAERLVVIEKVTGIPRHELRPDIFSVVDNSEEAA
jgi:DNA-binding transcriptional regulator YdaS (Cro superfamily)